MMLFSKKTEHGIGRKQGTNENQGTSTVFGGSFSMDSTQILQDETPVTPRNTASEGGTSIADSSPETGESSTPKQFRLLSDIYDETKEIEIENELLLLRVDEPLNYSQSIIEKEQEISMKNEIEAIEKNNTWKLVELASGHTPIGLKWVYKLKRDANGDVIKHNACLVAKGYVHKKGVDFDEVFAPVTRLETVR